LVKAFFHVGCVISSTKKNFILQQDPILREFAFNLIGQFQLEPNATTYEYYIDTMIASNEFERVMDFFTTIKSQNFKPSVQLYQKIIKGFISYNDDIIVLELMKMSEEDGYKLFSNMYLDILGICAYQYNVSFILLNCIIIIYINKIIISISKFN
jgi:hypothetical protein